MKTLLLPLLCLAILLSVLGGCASLSAPEEDRTTSEPDSEVRPPADGGGVKPAPGGESAGQQLDGVEGEHILIRDSFHARPAPLSPEDALFLQAFIDFHGTVVCAWELGNGFLGPAPVEVIDAGSGEVRYGRILEGYAYAVEETGDVPENYRVLLEDRIEYMCTADIASRSTYPLPERVVEQLWQPPGYGAPYDYARGRDLLAWCAREGIYVADGDGDGARLALANSDLPAALADIRWTGPEGERGVVLPPYEDSRLHYIAPMLMNGGRHVAATALLTGGDTGYDAQCVIVSYVNLETGEATHIARQLSWLGGPARRRGGGSLVAHCDEGPLLADVRDDDTPPRIYSLDKSEARFDQSWDYETFVRVRTGDDGVWELYRYRLEEPDAGEVILRAPGWEELYLRAVGESEILCAAADESGGEHLLLVPYERF